MSKLFQHQMIGGLGAAVAEGTDEYFQNTVLLLHGDGNQGATNFSNSGDPSYLAFKDNSDNNFPITVNGDAYGDNFGPYALENGYWSNYFDGNDDGVEAPSSSDFAWALDDFCVECWVSSLSTGSIWDQRPNQTNGNFLLLLIDASGYVVLNINSGTRIQGTISITDGLFHHVCVERNSGTFTLYIDGVADGTSTYGNSMSANQRVRLAHSAFTGGTDLSGSISNARAVNGDYVYGGAFTPSTSPLGITTGYNGLGTTVLLTAQSNRFVDNSPSAHTLTITGTPKVTVFNPFGVLPDGVNGSGFFDGTSDYVYLNGGTPLTFGTGDFTIECWVNMTSTPAAVYVFDFRPNGSEPNAPWCFVDSGQVVFGFAGSRISDTGAFTINANAWYHLAFVRNSGTFKLYVDGVEKGSISNTTDATVGTNRPLIGAAGSVTGVNAFPGYISNFRAVKGTAVYTTAFTPPASPLTAVTNTSLLTCQYAGTVRNVGFIDSGRYDFPITRVGNTTQGTFSPFSKPNGAWANYFSGTSDHLLIQNDASHRAGTSNFWVEGWFYSQATGLRPIVSVGLASSASAKVGWAALVDDMKFKFTHGPGTGLVSETDDVVLEQNRWYHFAVSRSGTGTNEASIWIDGIRVVQFTCADNFLGDQEPRISRWHSTHAARFNGFLSNIRYGIGTYGPYDPAESTITVPTTPLTNDAGTTLLTCQSNRFIDNSSNNWSITVGGTTKVTPFSPFPLTSAYNFAVNGGSAYFDGSSDYLSIASDAAFKPDTGDFSVSGWVYPLTADIMSPWGVRSGTSNNIGLTLNRNSSGTVTAGNLQAAIRDGNVLTVAAGITANCWQHVIFCKTGNLMALFVDGVRKGSLEENLGTNPTAAFRIGDSGLSRWMNGYVSDFEFVNGSRYDATQTTVTIPSAPITTPVGNTSLLCNFTNAGILDNTGFNALETVGNAQVDTSVVKYGTGAMKFDGTGDYLVGPDQPWVNFGTSDLTIECWVYFNSVGSTQMFVSSNYNASTGAGGWTFGYRADNTTLIFSVNANVQYGKTWSPSINTWYHVAVSRSGTDLRFFVDGTQLSTTSTSSDNISGATTLMVGSNLTTPQYLNGFIDDLRITAGVARYTTTFDPPIKAFPNIGV